MEESFCNIFEFVNTCWKDVFEKIQGSAVYIDHAATECLHWFKGDKAYLSLINAGAHSVHEIALFNFQYVKVYGTTKAIFIITSPDPAFYYRTLNMIVEKNTFESCIVVCAVHSTILKYSSMQLNNSQNNEDSYEKLREMILNWMKNTNPSKEPVVEIMFRPIFIAPITKNVFVAPPIQRLMPSIDGNITEEHEANVDYLVSSLHSLFTHFNIKENIYSMGKLSEYVAEKLENLPAAIDRRKALIGGSGVSLILVDRTLDLCTATKNNTECVLSRILCTLPHLPYHNNDVAVNMSSLGPDLEPSPLSMTVPGCLATEDISNLNLLIAKKQKDVLLTLNKWLNEMSETELRSPKAKLSTRVTAHSLEKLVHKFRDTQCLKTLAKCSKKLQIIMAVIQSLKSEKTSQLDLLVSLEKLILQNLAVSRDSTSVLSQISNLIKNRSARGLEMENLLVLLVHIYSLAGTEIHFSTSQEDQLKIALENAIFEDINKCNDNLATQEVSIYQQTLLLLGVTDESGAKESANKIMNQIMEILHLLADQRKNLQNYKSMIIKSSPQEMAQCDGLIERLLRDLLNPSKLEIKDLQRKTGSLISAGLNLVLKGRTNDHPNDNSWIIIYVLGGITAEETKIIEEISLNFKGSNYPQITLAGCRLLNPMDVTDKVLISNFNI